MLRRSGANEEVDVTGTVKLAAVAGEQVGRVRDEVAGALRSLQVQERAADLVEALRDAQPDPEALRARAEDVLAAAQARGRDLGIRRRELSTAIANRLGDLPVDEWAGSLGTALRDAGRTLAEVDAADHARRYAHQALQSLGDSLVEGRSGELLGLRRRRGIPWWTAAAGGAAIGFAAGWFLASRQQEDAQAEEFVASAERLVQDATERADARVASEAELRERISAALDDDARTRDLSALEVNVAGSTVFVRGDVPPGFDESRIREVIRTVSGVEDVDLEVRLTT